MTTNSKIRIKMGSIEVEFEGSEAFLKDELPIFLKTVSDLHAEHNDLFEPSNEGKSENSQAESSNKIVGTTGSIAAKLAIKSGTDLIIASAAQLTFVQNKEKFNRKDILDEMKSASAYYKSSYGSNLTTYLNKLVKDGTFLETSSGVYAISASKASNIKTRLG